jgi:hypothetical protein
VPRRRQVYIHTLLSLKSAALLSSVEKQADITYDTEMHYTYAKRSFHTSLRILQIRESLSQERTPGMLQISSALDTWNNLFSGKIKIQRLSKTNLHFSIPPGANVILIDKSNLPSRFIILKSTPKTEDKNCQRPSTMFHSARNMCLQMDCRWLDHAQ